MPRIFTPTRRRSLIFVLTLLAMTALATVSFARHSWRKYHWARTTNPFTIKLGMLIRTTNGGRTQLFEKDLGAGHKVFTFVIWADAESESLDEDGHNH